MANLASRDPESTRDDEIIDTTSLLRPRVPFTSQPSLKKSASSLLLSFTGDWISLIGLVALTFFLEVLPARNSYVSKAYLSKYAYPLKPNTVPSWIVPLYSVLVPAGVVATCIYLQVVPTSTRGVTLMVFGRTTGRGLYLHQVIKALLTSVFLAITLTNAIKIPVARPRPDFLARCWPDGKMVWESEDQFGGFPKCTGPPAVAREGRKSFPSGHSSCSAAGLCFLTMWLLSALRPTAQPYPCSWRMLVSLLPSLAAVAVAVSRVVDYWHHWEDVTVGLLLGLACAYVTFRPLQTWLGHQHVGKELAGDAGAEPEMLV